MLRLGDGVPRLGCIDDEIGTQGILDVDGTQKRVRRDLAMVEPDGSTIAIPILVTDGQLDVAVVLSEDTTIHRRARTRKRLSDGVDGD